MADFRFALQPALDGLRAAEDSARAMLFDARRACDIAGARTIALEERLGEARSALVLGPSPPLAAELALAEAAIVALGAALRRSEALAERARSILERARAHYGDVAKRRSGLERLRERRYEAYRERIARAEEAEFDASRRTPGRDDDRFEWFPG